METIKAITPTVWLNYSTGKVKIEKDIPKGYSIPLFTQEELAKSYQSGINHVDANKYVPIGQYKSLCENLEDANQKIIAMRKALEELTRILNAEDVAAARACAGY